MTGVDFVNNYHSNDGDELFRVEQFHTDLHNTLAHYANELKADEEPTFYGFVAWLAQKGNE